MQVFNEPIPKNKIKQFHDILCATGGRYLKNPVLVGNEYRVSYAPGDYIRQQKAWRMVTEDISEVRKDQLWRKALRRAKLFLKGR